MNIAGSKREDLMNRMSRITVIGAGVSGRALAILASKLGYSVFVSELGSVDPQTRELFHQYGIDHESDGHSERILECDAMVLSSGVSPRSRPVARALEEGVAIIGEVDFVAPFLKGAKIGVTGSNGKTTTTLLTGHLLKESGFRVGVAGNVGSPLADHAFVENDVVVAELSSFQLFWAKELSLDVAVVTNLDPDHIDWHGSVEEYYDSKRKITSMLKDGGSLICQERDLPVLYQEGPPSGSVFPLRWQKDRDRRRMEGLLMKDDHAVMISVASEKNLFRYTDVPLLGRHNLENAAMSSATLIIQGGQADTLKRALATFEAPPHRCEPVGIVKGVSFIDDSKGTNVAATVTALGSLEGRKVVILGGKGKGENYDLLAEAVAKGSEAAVLLGDEKTRIRVALEKRGFQRIIEVSDMGEAVREAFRASSPGGMVLLSPACTSWDMYANYKERGEDFRRWVKILEKERY
ncbi:MAG: UDP-N-acetylmuramoylalanine--D-glutamate ligase [Synergistales bacterium 58_81]|nr:MAG: UDP-N-acetylmuramoylalanine--D-glutamate ligase [Synergistales bacterium 57_84]KUK88664.1 MAG: UDP-N-acetylmuramoylalanine--D-glutamate ligase [Synergistales bacterium 58_81]